MNSKLKINVFGIVFLIIATFLDQISKSLAVSFLKDKAPIDLIPGVFELRYLENQGAAFGLFQHRQILFVIIAIIILIAGFLFYQNFPMTSRFLPIRLCILCIASGAIGNMIDRVILGYVVDFFYFVMIDFPIFNVADIYVTVSIAVLIILILFYYSDDDMQYFSFHRGEK